MVSRPCVSGIGCEVTHCTLLTSTGTFVGTNCSQDFDGIRTSVESLGPAAGPPYAGLCRLQQVDVDECALGLDNCDRPAAICVNTPGSFTCTCNSTYRGLGLRAADGGRGRSFNMGERRATFSSNFGATPRSLGRLGDGDSSSKSWLDSPNAYSPDCNVSNAPSVQVDLGDIFEVVEVGVTMAGRGSPHCGRSVELSYSGAFAGELGILYLFPFVVTQPILRRLPARNQANT
mmetsp:Transcript_5221/g.16719  ORF Transcript_5221/g.16719 Transcript_5221/m.16719 type:complete len:232 (-) Transcript_5221:11-706(-)